MSFQIVVCGLAVSSDGSSWGIIAAGLAWSDARSRAVLLADRSGHMSGMEAVERVIGLGPTVSVAAVAAPGEARVRALFASSVGYGRVPPTPIEVTVGDASGLWVGVLKPLYQGARISHVAGLEELERALRDYHPETESPRVAAVLAAIVYLQAIGGLTTGSPWTEPLRSPPVADAMHAGQDKDRIRMVERLGGKVD